jgi:hypothetical protein
MMRAARKQNKGVQLVVDNLYIDGELQEPKDTLEMEYKKYSTERVADTPRTSGIRERSANDSCPTAPPREKRARRSSSTPSKMDRPGGQKTKLTSFKCVVLHVKSQLSEFFLFHVYIAYVYL